MNNLSLKINRINCQNYHRQLFASGKFSYLLHLKARLTKFEYINKRLLKREMIKFSVALLLVVAVSRSETSMGSEIEVNDEVAHPPGSYSEAGKPSYEDRAMIKGLKSDIEAKAGQYYSKFNVIAITT